MQTSRLLLLFALTVVMVSCRKETSFSAQNSQTQNNNNQNTQTRTNGDDQLLIKKVDLSGKGDSTLFDYTYDTEGRLISERFTGISQNNGVTKIVIADELYYRDTVGRITTIVKKYGQPVEGSVYKPVCTRVVYENAGSKKILYTKTTISAGDKTTFDSTLFFYNNNNLVVKTVYYRFDSISPSTTALKSMYYETWDYDSKGNLTQLKQYSNTDNSGSYAVSVTCQFEYDAKINPLYSNDDARLQSSWYSSASPNNLLKQKNIYALGREDDDLTTYEYKTNGRPAAATFRGNGMTIQSVYYYK